MNEIEKLEAWMLANDYSVARIAASLEIAYINAYMNIVKRRSLSDDFKLRFRERFGEVVASQIFDAKLQKEESHAHP